LKLILKKPFCSAGYAHVIFQNKESLKNVLKNTSFDLSGKFEFGQKKGLEKWTEIYQKEYFVKKSKVQSEVDSYMWNYDKKNLEHQQKIEALSSAPDADGWVTVTRKGKKKSGADGKNIRVAPKLDLATINRIREKERKKYKDNFYRFQKAEKRINHIEELRKRFEEDKKRIEKMRQGRKFRPF